MTLGMYFSSRSNIHNFKGSMRKQCMAYKSGFILPKKGVIEAKFQKGLSLSSKFIHYRLT